MKSTINTTERLRRERISATLKRNGPSELWKEKVCGSGNSRWKGDKAGYTAFHNRVRKTRGKASRCEMTNCPGTSKRFEWANLTGNYHDVNDYKQMYKSCHLRFDGISFPSILTPDEVRAIRSLQGKYPQRVIADVYSVKRETVSAIMTGRNWANVQ
jgi:hypothetical protein